MAGISGSTFATQDSTSTAYDSRADPRETLSSLCIPDVAVSFPSTSKFNFIKIAYSGSYGYLELFFFFIPYIMYC